MVASGPSRLRIAHQVHNVGRLDTFICGGRTKTYARCGQGEIIKAVLKKDAPVVIEGAGVEVRLQEIGGGMSTSFIRLPKGADLGPALKGLTDDRCQCPHWGYILKGRVQMQTKDGDKVYEARQAVYWAPGHVPVALEDSEYVDFSPTEEFNEVIDHIRAQRAERTRVGRSHWPHPDGATLIICG